MRARLIAAVVASLAWAIPAHAAATETIWLRGHAQLLRTYGQRGGPAAIVSSGDGGWIHLGPHVAETLAARGYFVVGFDVRAYLSSFTTGTTTLRPEDEPRDYKTLVEFAARGSSGRPVLVGVSEGAGLSVLAATDSDTRARIGGVVALGLPDVNELGWRWRDAMIYVTHRSPNEPSFSAASLIGRAAPAPIAVIHSTRDEFVPVNEVQRVVANACEPKRLWLVEAADHRFSNNLAVLDRTLFDALLWLKSYSTT
jgi:alpha-beta hydrolase superfamily lysophospholipase